jgi:SAM-dependent methyltransferase
MDEPGMIQPQDGDVEAIRLQAEEHPLIEDEPSATPAEHCLRLMHLRAYDEAITQATGCDVLDVGCNTGYGTIRFVPVARRVVGVDVSTRAIEAARLRAVDGRPEFVATSGFDLPFGDATFDLVTSFQVIEHVPDAMAYLREIRRVTRPGGTVILATPNAATRLYPGMTPWNRFHVREYLASELQDLLDGAFPTVRIRGMFGTPTLYETEIRRVDAARQRIRRKTEAEARNAEVDRESGHGSVPHGRVAAAPPVRRPLPIRLARATMPRFARAWVRSVLAPSEAKATTPVPPLLPGPAVDPEMDLETFLRFSVEDLFYADHDLDRAMDLLAICELDGRGTL